MTCQRTQEFLATANIEVTERVNARSRRLAEREALALLAGADELYSAKGKRVVHLDLKRDRPPRAELLALMLGPTGNLRAPTLRRGRTVLVGFDAATWARALG